MIIADSGQAEKKERHIDWFSFKKTISITKTKPWYMSYTGWQLFTILILVSSLRLFSRYKLRKKIRSLKATTVVFQSVLSAHLPFWFVLRWVTEAPSSLAGWITKISPYWHKRWAGSCECNGARRVSTKVTILSSWSLGSEQWAGLFLMALFSLTDWNLY